MRARTEHESTSPRSRAHRNPATPARRVLSALLVALGLLVPFGAVGAPADGAGQGTHADLGPVASWLSDYKKGLEKAKKELEDAEDMVAAIFTGMPSGNDLLMLGLHLDAAEMQIAAILDPTVEPSLAPSNAGTIDRSVRPTTVEDYAETCRMMITEALLEAEIDSVGSAEFVGTQLRTIASLLDGYRDAAGL